MKRRTALTVGVGAAAGAAGLGLAWWMQQGRQEKAPPVRGTDLPWWNTRFERPEGGSLSLADFKSRRLLLNFWATWCPPCVKEMPMLDAFAQARQSQGWQVIGLALDRLAPVQSFLKRLPVSFPVGIAGVEGLELSQALGNAKGQLPFSAVWDFDALLIASKLGAITPDDLEAWARL